MELCLRVDGSPYNRSQRSVVEKSFTLSLTSAPEEGEWSTPRPGRFTPGKNPVPIVPGCLARPGRKQAMATGILMFMFPIYNHNWRNISAIYIYITRLASNEIFSPSNKKHREVGRAKDLSAPLYRRLGGPQGRSGRVRKISPPPGLNPRTVQPAASRCTDWANPAYCYERLHRFVNTRWRHRLCCSTQPTTSLQTSHSQRLHGNSIMNKGTGTRW